MTSTPSFGVCLAGIPVLMPAGTALEFIAQAPLHPLPLAPARVAGLMQLRGQPLVVLDASSRPARRRPIVSHDVLVVGTMPQAAALLVDGPPQRVLGATSPEPLSARRVGALSECPFVDALTAHRADPDGGDAGWYEIDPARLFDALVQG